MSERTMRHEEKVRRIAADLRARGRSNEGPVSLAKAAISHFVPNPHDPRHRDRKLDVRDLTEILEIDVAGRTCTAESGVTFSDLVRATLPHGLAPTLVPELRTITIGGAVAGCAVESTSFRSGGFHDGCVEYEIVTATGEVLVCSREREPEIFEMIHGSYGTLGVLTKLTFRLVPAEPFVRVDYVRCADAETFRERLERSCEDPAIDFVDAIVHARDCFVLCLGRYVREVPRPPSSYTGVEIYYRSTLRRAEDFLTTDEYFFRYDTDCHWTTRAIPGMHTELGRLLLGRFFLGSTNLLAWAERLRPITKLRKHLPVVIDLFVPRRRFAEFYGWYEREVGHYPLWIVPYRMREPYAWIAPGHRTGDDLFIDVAIYGVPNDRPGIDLSRMLEQKTYELAGIKTLISENHYDAGTFWSIYDRERYQRVKERTDPAGLFRDLYEKLHFGRGGARPSETSLGSGAALTGAGRRAGSRC